MNDIKNNFLMKSVLIFSLIFLCNSCNTDITYNFADNEFNINAIRHKFILENNSEFHYVFYSFNPTGISDPLISKNSIIITDDQNNRIIERPVFINYKDNYNYKKDSMIMNYYKSKNFLKDLYWFRTNKEIKKNAIFLNKENKKKFNGDIALSFNQIKNSSSYFLLEKNMKYSIQLVIDFDSIKIKEYLTPDDLDSLKRNNIKIFHGKLKTKKIPLLLD